jgi:hypothetical protein
MANRIDETQCSDWRPLSSQELQALNCVKPRGAKLPISRATLVRLLGERERLVMVTESAAWMLETLDQGGLDEIDSVKRVMTVLREALECAGMIKPLGKPEA